MEKGKTKMDKIKQVLKAYKTLRKSGFSIGDICGLVNWSRAKAMAEKSGLAWVKIIVSIMGGICAMSSDEQAGIEKVIDLAEKELA